ncbi:MAG: hypothetical protein ACRC3H_22070 [Lachnospiraceae bacterium]
MEMMCFVVIHKNDGIIYQGMQIDDGTAALEYAKKNNARARVWEMYGMAHFWELPHETKVEIKSFIKGLR